jgi:hypothetical protein
LAQTAKKTPPRTVLFLLRHLAFEHGFPVRVAAITQQTAVDELLISRLLPSNGSACHNTLEIHITVHTNPFVDSWAWHDARMRPQAVLEAYRHHIQQ